MTLDTIQVTQEGVLIPRHYFLQDATEFEIELIDGSVLVRPKPSSATLPEVHKRFPWIGIGSSADPTASERVEEILAAEIDLRAGWTHDPDKMRL